MESLTLQVDGPATCLQVDRYITGRAYDKPGVGAFNQDFTALTLL